MSDAQTGFGVTLTGATAGVIGNIISIGGPNETRDSIDVSTMESPDQAREFIAGMIDSGEITFTCNYDGSAAGTGDSLHTAFVAGLNEVWTLVFSDTSIDAALGMITALGKAIPFDDKVTQDITIKLSGIVTFSDVAA